MAPTRHGRLVGDNSLSRPTLLEYVSGNDRPEAETVDFRGLELPDGRGRVRGGY